MTRSLRMLLMVPLVVVVWTACGGGGEGTGDGRQWPPPTPAGEETPRTIDIEGEQANFHGLADVGGEDEVELEMDDFYFEPTILEGEPGQKIHLHLHNEGQVVHNFSLREQRIDVDVRPGEEGEASVTFPDARILQFTCKYHLPQGMVGGLSV